MGSYLYKKEGENKMMLLEDITFHEVIKEIRKKHGLSQAEFGKKFGIDQQAVSKWERGRGFPEVATLIKIAAFAGITVDELLFHTHLTREELESGLNDDQLVFISETRRKKITAEELKKQYNLFVDDVLATEEEIEEAIKAIRFKRFND